MQKLFPDAVMKQARAKVDCSLIRRVAKMHGGPLRFFNPERYLIASMDVDFEVLRHVMVVMTENSPSETRSA